MRSSPPSRSQQAAHTLGAIVGTFHRLADRSENPLRFPGRVVMTVVAEPLKPAIHALGRKVFRDGPAKHDISIG